ncbi:MAG: hypothetical protein Q9208_004220 [Pyrenodesmia sp. 3 TL-2023]
MPIPIPVRQQIRNISTRPRSKRPRPRPWPPYQGKIFQPFIPKLVKDGEIDGEGNGSDAYHAENEYVERWDAAYSQLKTHSLADLYALSPSERRSYYLRMHPDPDPDPNGGGTPHARLIRHCGSILPFCEVVHVVHPGVAFRLLQPTEEEAPTERSKRVMRALGVEDVSFLESLLGRREAQDVKVVILRGFWAVLIEHGDPPDLKRWDRSTGEGYDRYRKAVTLQWDVVIDSLAKAVGAIARGDGDKE